MMPFSSDSFIGLTACWFYFRSIGHRAIRTCGQGSCVLTCYMLSLPGELPPIISAQLEGSLVGSYT